MTIKNAAVSSVLILMFLSLLAIYYVVRPANSLITFLCVLIMLVGLIMSQSQSWRDISILAAVSVIVSLVAVALMANTRFGTLGTLVAVVAWSLFLFALFSSVQRSIVPLPQDRAILIRNTLTGYVRLADGPIAEPNLPFMESIIATIPLYVLSVEMNVEKVNTQRQNVDLIDLDIRYRVKEPQRALSGIPNLTQAQAEIAKEMNKDIAAARLDIAFWEKLLNRQMRMDVDRIVRDVIFDNVFAQNPLEVGAKREDLAHAIRDRLQHVVSHWGVELLELRFERVDVSGDVAKSINKAGVRLDETEQKKLEAERDATRINLVLEAEVKAEARRVSAIIEALKEAGVDITPELVVQALKATSDWQMQGDYSVLTQQPLVLPAPAPAKPPEKK